jgi:hypothetical protein
VAQRSGLVSRKFQCHQSPETNTLGCPHLTQTRAERKASSSLERRSLSILKSSIAWSKSVIIEANFARNNNKILSRFNFSKRHTLLSVRFAACKKNMLGSPEQRSIPQRTTPHFASCDLQRENLSANASREIEIAPSRLQLIWLQVHLVIFEQLRARVQL